MSSDIAIRAQHLGKRYDRKIGRAHDSLRDALQAGVANLVASKEEREANQRRDSFWALEDASFDIAKGENVGIIGLNGAGKSTLLKILSRITTPTLGEARINGRLGALLEVGTGFHPELTGRENVFLNGAILGMSRKEVAAKFDAIVEFSEIEEFIDTPVKHYSSGMYVRLAFAVSVHLDPDILLLDEVLAVGDAAFQRKCMNFVRKLQQRGSTILFVSHNMFSIKAMCQRVIYLRKGRIVFDGATDEGLKLYEDDSRLRVIPWLAQSDPDVVVTDITLMREDGRESGVFDYGAQMSVRVRYKARRPIAHPDFRLSINREDDVVCTTYSSVADGYEIPSIDGEGEIILKTPPLLIVSDLYNVNMIIKDSRDAKVLTAQVGPSFHIRHAEFESITYGVFRQQGEWSTSALPHAVEQRLSAS